MRGKRLLSEIDLAHARDQLIEKAHAVRQLQYMLISMRQKLLILPEKMRQECGPERFNYEMVRPAKVLVVEVLTAVSQLPEAADPNWLKKLEEDE